MKVWFLVMYLFHGYGLNWHYNSSYGGPSMSVVKTTSKEQCEELGSKIKHIMDWPTQKEKESMQYWCIDIVDKEGTDVESRKRIIREQQKLR